MSKLTFKKRPKKFFGIPAWKLPSSAPSPALSDCSTNSCNSYSATNNDEIERPIPIQLSAGSKKLAISRSLPTTSDLEESDSQSMFGNYMDTGSLTVRRIWSL